MGRGGRCALITDRNWIANAPDDLARRCSGLPMCSAAADLVETVVAVNGCAQRRRAIRAMLPYVDSFPPAISIASLRSWQR